MKSLKPLEPGMMVKLRKIYSGYAAAVEAPDLTSSTHFFELRFRGPGIFIDSTSTFTVVEEKSFSLEARSPTTSRFVRIILPNGKACWIPRRNLTII